jgi:hypothetical protein
MRAVFGILSLLLVVAVVGLLAKKQFAAVSDIKVPQTAPVAGTPALPAITAGGNAQQQSQQIQQQFKAAAEASMQQARPMPDEKP